MAKLDERVGNLERENAELRRQLDEALAQQTAAAEVLQVINSSPGDLAPVFDAMLEKAMILCGAALGALMSYDGEKVSAVATRGLPPELVDVFREPIAPRRDGDAPYARFLRGEPLQHIVDMATDDVLPSLASRPRALVEFGGARTGLGIPLRKEGALLGSIWFYRREVRPFSDKQIALVQNFAAQAVIAMENARLITETREALDQQTATAEVLQVINSSPGDLAPVFDAILQKAHALCDVTTGGLMIRDGDQLRVVAVHAEPGFVEFWRQQGPIRPPPDTPLERVVRDGQVVHLPDAREDAAYNKVPAFRRLIDAGDIRTLLLVPLLRDDALAGVITAFRQEVRAFTDKQIALLQNFAAQAVVAMENARLITETREALEQQTATAEVLQVINSSPGDLAPVFDAMLEKAIRLCESDFGILWKFDHERAVAAALHRVPAAYAELVREPFKPSPESGPARMIRGDGTFVVADLLEFPPYQAGDTLVRAMVDLAGARSVVIAPLRKDGTTIGAITIYRQEVRPFTDKQIALLQNFAAQAVIAMENARLITETREALEQQTATAEVLQVINSSPGDLRPVFEAMLDKALRLGEAAFGMMHTYDGEQFPVAAMRGVPEAYTEYRKQNPVVIAPGTGPARILAGENVIHIADLETESAYRAGEAGDRAVIDLAGARSILSAALRREGLLLGMLTIFRQEVRPFSDKQIALLQNFAAQAVIAMENARLLGELRERTEEVAGWNRELEARVAAQLDELGRIEHLKRFLPPQLAELVVAQGDETILKSHRREIVVVFADVRGYTSFTETAEPEEVIEFLGEYHAALGPLITLHEGTLSHFLGDGVMVFFNDPVPCPDPAERAVRMALAMREAASGLVASWRRRGHQLGFGVGIAQGYATLGQIGFADRSDYTAIGTVTNLAARLCDEAKDGQILVARRIALAVEGSVMLDEVGALALKGLTQPVVAFNVVAGIASAAAPGEERPTA